MQLLPCAGIALFMKYYRILNDSEADEQDSLEGHKIENACWSISPRLFLCWFLLGWISITVLCLFIGTLIPG
jgi:hypothetical protein